MENYSPEDELTMAGLAGELTTQVTVTISLHKPKPKRKKKPQVSTRGTRLNRVLVNSFSEEGDNIEKLPKISRRFDVKVEGEAIGLKYARKIANIDAQYINNAIEECKNHFAYFIKTELQNRKQWVGTRSDELKVTLK